MFNSYMLLTLPFKTAPFHLCDVHYSEVAHLHENGRLSERDKPKASSCELDVVFGIPNSREKGFLPPADAELASSKHLAPSTSAPALPALIIFWVQRLRKYCCNPVWLRRKQRSPSGINLSLVSRRTARRWASL